MDGAPATGVKFSVVKVTDGYVPQSYEEVLDVQYDAHGHLVVVEGGFGSSSSQSSASPSSESSRSGSVSSESSESGAPGYSCPVCSGASPNSWHVTLEDWVFDFDGSTINMSGTYTNITYDRHETDICFYYIGGSRYGYHSYDATYEYNIQLIVVGRGVGSNYQEWTVAIRRKDTPAGASGITKNSPDFGAGVEICADSESGAHINIGAGVTNVDPAISWKSDARF
jgi:hypothetical protein